MSKFLECSYCGDTYFWADSCNCPIHAYYDYMEDKIYLLRVRNYSFDTHCGDYNLVYLGSL